MFYHLSGYDITGYSMTVRNDTCLRGTFKVELFERKSFCAGLYICLDTMKNPQFNLN